MPHFDGATEKNTRTTVYMTGAEDAPVVFDLAKNCQICFTQALREIVRGIRASTPFPTDRLDNLKTLRLMEFSYVVAGVRI